MGNGDGTFGKETDIVVGKIPYSVSVGDLNGDGKADLAVTVNDSSGNTTAGVAIALGNGNGTFQAPKLTSLPQQGTTLEVTFPYAKMIDLNRDGHLDLVYTNAWSSTVNVIYGKGDGTFYDPLAFGSSRYTWDLAFGDANGDGVPDVVTTGNGPLYGFGFSGVTVLLNSGGNLNALQSSQNPSNSGELVTFTSNITTKVRGVTNSPTGTIGFYDGSTLLSTQPLANGQAAFSTNTLSVGTHNMTGQYSGDTNFVPTTSPVLVQIVQQTGPIVVLSPTSLNFGNQNVGTTSTPQNVMLTNTGSGTLTITSIGITGTNSGDFAQTNNCGSSVPPNGNCQISVTFTPTDTGNRNAAVSIADNAPGSPQSVSLSGVGIAPGVTFFPTSLTFPNQVVFTASSEQQVTLTNTGTAVLTITRISTSGPFSQTNNCPGSLNPNGNCTINVKFHPQKKGVQLGTVAVEDNAPGSPQKVRLKGTGTFVQLIPAKVNFGGQPVGTKSLAKKITLTNKGGSAVNITAIVMTGTDAGDFAETNNCGKSVPSGASCFIKVTFKPLAKGRRTAEVSVYDDGGGSPQQVALAGTGT